MQLSDQVFSIVVETFACMAHVGFATGSVRDTISLESHAFILILSLTAQAGSRGPRGLAARTAAATEAGTDVGQVLTCSVSSSGIAPVIQELLSIRNDYHVHANFCGMLTMSTLHGVRMPTAHGGGSLACACKSTQFIIIHQVIYLPASQQDLIIMVLPYS